MHRNKSQTLTIQLDVTLEKNKHELIHKIHNKMRKNENLLLPSLQASDQRLSGVPEPQRLFERSKAKKTTI